MTANLKRFDPAGTDGAAATATGNLTSVIIGGAGAVTYEADYGMSRGSNMGLRAVSPGTADQANITVATTAAANGTGQVYGSFENWHTGASDQEVVTLRTSAGNCIRFMVSTAGVIKVQNRAGSTVATLGSISLATPYRFELEATPNTTITNGVGAARVYDDDDNLVYTYGPTTGNFGGDLATKTVSILRVGDPTTASLSGFAFGFTQPAIDTDATAPPTITPVAKTTNGSVTAVAPSATVTATAPTVLGQMVAAVTAVAAAITMTAMPPTVDGESIVSGGGAPNITFTAVAPTVTTSGGATVAAVASAATLTAQPPAVTGQRNATSTSPASTLAVAVPAPAIAGVRTVTVVAVAPGTTLGTIAPTVAAGGTVTATSSQTTLATQAPTVQGVRSPTVAPTATAITAAALAPAVAGERNTTVTAIAATVTLTATAPEIAAAGVISIEGATITRAGTDVRLSRAGTNTRLHIARRT